MKITQIPDLAVHNARVPLELETERRRIAINEIDDELSEINDLIVASTQIRYARSNHSYIPEFAIKLLTEFCPVVVVETKTGYSCIGNRRVLTIARMALGENNRIPVTIVSKQCNLIRFIALVDLFVLPMIHIISPAQQDNLRAACDILDENNSDVVNKVFLSKYTRKKKISSGSFNIINTYASIHFRLNDFTFISESAAHIVTILCPPRGYIDESNNYHNLVNKRALNVALDILPAPTELDVVTVKHEAANDLIRIENSVIATTHALWKHAGCSLAHLFLLMSRADKKMLFDVNLSKSKLSKFTGFRREDMFNRIKTTNRVTHSSEGHEDLRRYGIGREEDDT
ncbi:MAG: hypothetical protein OQK54_00565 [Gammaproteobacteria bacterium]|nr:hypothetical protein [Gammaproteobacteria bacterium]